MTTVISVRFRNGTKTYFFDPRDLTVAPGDDVVVETDCPWLTPVPFRGRRNEPSYVRFAAGKIAQIKDLPLESVAAATTENARRLFKL